MPKHAGDRVAERERQRIVELIGPDALELLEHLGYTIVRFWNNEVLNNQQAVLQRIANVLGVDERSTIQEIPSPRLRGEG